MTRRLYTGILLILFSVMPPFLWAEEIKQLESIILLSRIPPAMHEGDLFKGGVAVVNRSDRNLAIDISGNMKGYEDKALNSRTETLAAGESREIVWDISVPHGMPVLSYEFTAQERDGTVRAVLAVKQKVVEAVPLRIVSASQAQVETFFDIDVEPPKGAMAGKGGVTVTIAPRLEESLGAVEAYMAQYHYEGLEQKISRAVALSDEELWKNTVKELPDYFDDTGLVKHLQAAQHGDVALTAYVIAISDEAGWSMPDEVKKRLEEGLRAFVADRMPWSRQLTEADLLIRKISAFEALSRNGAVDINSLVAPLTIESLPSSAVMDLINILRRTVTLPDREARIREAEQVLRSRTFIANRRLAFSTEKSDFLPSLMVSTDVNAARLLLACMEAEDWKREAHTIAAGLLRRQQNGTWQTTTANAWGVMAVKKYSRRLESAAISGKTSVAFAGLERHVEWSGSAAGLRIRFDWPQRKEMLTIHHQGMGRPWIMIQGTTAVPLKEPVSSGLSIKKMLIPVEQRQPGRWTKGDIVKIRITIEAESDLPWVLINDPLPGGAAVLDSGVGTRRFVSHNDEKDALQLAPILEFSSPGEFRAYVELMPKGLWSGEYLIRLQSSGTFGLAGTRVEALYSPGVFGELPYRIIEISEGN